MDILPPSQLTAQEKHHESFPRLKKMRKRMSFRRSGGKSSSKSDLASVYSSVTTTQDVMTVVGASKNNNNKTELPKTITTTSPAKQYKQQQQNKKEDTLSMLVEVMQKNSLHQQDHCDNQSTSTTSGISESSNFTPATTVQTTSSPSYDESQVPAPAQQPKAPTITEKEPSSTTTTATSENTTQTVQDTENSPEQEPPLTKEMLQLTASDSWTTSDHAKLCRRLYSNITGQHAAFPTQIKKSSLNMEDDGLTYCTTTTERFDWLLWQHLEAAQVKASAQKNVAAVQAFCDHKCHGDKQFACREFITALTNRHAMERKYQLLHHDNKQRSLATFELAAQLLFQETIMLTKFGFSVDAYGVCIVLALLKAYASATDVELVMGVSADRLQEAFVQFYKAEGCPPSSSSATEPPSRSYGDGETD